MRWVFSNSRAVRAAYAPLSCFAADGRYFHIAAFAGMRLTVHLPGDGESPRCPRRVSISPTLDNIA
jgi:hypothetical protein